MNFSKGQKVPAFRLATVGGISTALKDLLGRPTLFVGWASWDDSRDFLPLLEKFHRKHGESVRVVSIAFEAWTLDHCNRYLKAASWSHLALVDASFLLSRVWGAREVPFAVMIDDEGYAQLVDVPGEGLFPKVLAALKKKAERKPTKAAKRPKGVQHPRVEILMQEGMNYLTRQRTEDALGFWRKASSLDPDNAIIKKQIAALQNPAGTYGR